VDRLKNLRNVAIVLLIAAAVYELPGGGRAASIFESILFVAFGVAIGYLGLRMYREGRVAVHGRGDRHRALLYGALGLAAVIVIGQKRLWQSGLGELVWFMLAGLVVYALLAVWRHSRSY